MIAKTLLPPEIDYDREWGELTRSRFRPFVELARSRRIRRIEEFAEDEIILPTGPREGLKFSLRTQPFARLFWKEFSNPHWNDYAFTGSTQTGKSLLGFAIPVVWKLCELQEDVIIAGPSIELLQDKVKRDIYPLIGRTRFKDVIPTEGGGSKGGVPDRIDLKNGRVLKLMSFGGGDKSKASFTCPNIFMTEVDAAAGQSTSEEANPLEQILGRARATERRKRFVVYECTVSTEQGHIWQLYTKKGSYSKIMLPCPKCKVYVTPERENLKGWQESESEIEAEEKTNWHCPACDARWTEKQRHEANHKGKLIHGEQTIDKRGRIKGDLPLTRTLGFRFSAVNSLLLPASDIGSDCWNARANPDEIDAEKKITQFVFAQPFEMPGFDKVRIDIDVAERRQLDTTKGRAPTSTKWITIGGDVRKRQFHWVATAFLIPERVRFIVDYGELNLGISHNGKWLTADDLGFDQVFSECVGKWKEEVDKGWESRDGEVLDFDHCWIDARWQGDENDVDVVYAELKRWGDKRVLPCMGHGSNNYKRTKYAEPKLKGSKDVISRGHHYHIRWVNEIMSRRVHIATDPWKVIAQRSISMEENLPGSTMLYGSKNPKEHTKFMKHITAETRERSYKKKKGKTEEWVVHNQANHFLDAFVYSLAAGHHAGFRARENNEKKTPSRQPRASSALQGRNGKSFVASQR